MRSCKYRHSISLKAIMAGILLAHVLTVSAEAQISTATTSSNSTSISPDIKAFQTEQRALGMELKNLVDQGATPAQIRAWHQQNAARFAAQQQRAQAISAGRPAQPIPYVTSVEIPEGASQTTQDFLKAQADLHNRRAQLHNQQLQSGSKIDEAQVEAAMQQWRQQNAGRFQQMQ